MLKIILKALTLQTMLGRIFTPLILKTLPSLTKENLEQEKCLNCGTLHITKDADNSFWASTKKIFYTS